jgi:hypothetical protein
MNPPFRLRVLMALQNCMQAMTPANGYTYDLSQSVFVGRDMFGDDDPVPLIAILEDPDTPPLRLTPRDATDRVNTWTLLIQGFINPDQGDMPLRPAYVLAAETAKALIDGARRMDGHTPDYFGMGGRVDRFALGPAIVRPAEIGVSDKAFFWLRLTLEIVENLLDPYE